VYVGFDTISREDVAIKIEKNENDEIKSLEREVAILTKLTGI